MFNVTKDMLEAIFSISHELPGEWGILTRELNQIRDDHVAHTLHEFPDPADMNYMTRLNMNRGISIALDVISRVFENPADVLEDIRLIDESSYKNVPDRANPAT